MENIIYEKDYKEEHERAAHDSKSVEIFKQAFSGGMMQRYADAMDAMPKVIVPEYRENYEYLLRKCDAMAKRTGGSIRGVVNYQKWEATIDLFLPYAEFDCPEDLTLLREMAEKSHYINIQATENGGVQIHLYNYYFKELVSEEHRQYLEYDAIMQDPELAEMLGIPAEMPPHLESLADFLNGLLDMVEEATPLDRTTIFKALLTRAAEQDQDGNNILETMEQAARDLIEENKELDT